MDIVGPLPPSNGFTYLFTVVDCFSRWPEAIPRNDITSITCAQAPHIHWIARLGIPIDLSSDRGAQFTSQLWTSIDHYLLPPAIQWHSRKVPQTSEGSGHLSQCLVIYFVNHNFQPEHLLPTAATPGSRSHAGTHAHLNIPSSIPQLRAISVSFCSPGCSPYTLPTSVRRTIQSHAGRRQDLHN